MSKRIYLHEGNDGYGWNTIVCPVVYTSKKKAISDMRYDNKQSREQDLKVRYRVVSYIKDETIEE